MPGEEGEESPYEIVSYNGVDRPREDSNQPEDNRCNCSGAVLYLCSPSPFRAGTDDAWRYSTAHLRHGCIACSLSMRRNGMLLLCCQGIESEEPDVRV